MIISYFGRSAMWRNCWVGKVLIGPRQDLMNFTDFGNPILCLFEIELRYPWYLSVRSNWREILRRQPIE